MIDLIDADSYISDLVEGETYLVGNKRSRYVYICKREGINFVYTEFSFNAQHLLCRRVENYTHVRGFDKKKNKFFEETLRFDEVSVQELLYRKIPAYVKTDDGISYIREYLPVKDGGFTGRDIEGMKF